MKTVVLATPHSRNDGLVDAVTRGLSGCRVVQIHGPEELTPDCLGLLKPHWIFFPHWSWMIPEAIFENFRCVIFHMTDLPYGRGGSPLQNLILQGRNETRLSALRCVKELDAGPIYLKRQLSLAGSAEEILQRASNQMEEMVLEIVRSEPEPVAQQGDVVVFKRRQPEDGNIWGLQSIEDVFDFIRMLDADGYPQAFIDTEHMHLEFSNAELCAEFVEAKVRIRRKNK